MRNGFVPLLILVLALLALLFAPIPLHYEIANCAQPLRYPDQYRPCPSGLTLGWSPSIAQILYKRIQIENMEPPETDEITGKPCGGIAGETGELACPKSYKCKYPEPVFPDAQGQCVRL